MNRRVFASRIANQTGHPATTVEAILEAVISVLAGELVKVGRSEWRGFGTFTVRTYPAPSLTVGAEGRWSVRREAASLWPPRTPPAT